VAEYSYNGWLASKNPDDFGGLEPLVVAGEPFSPGVRAGDVATVLRYVAEQMHRRVEPVYKPGFHEADDWGYSYRANVNNPSTLSCHSSGTAIDYNATRHPNGKRGTFSAAQVNHIHAILDEVERVVRWGGDFSGTPDEMHLEINANASAVARVAARLREQSPDPNHPAPSLPEEELPSVDDVWSHPIDDAYTPESGDNLPAFAALAWANAHAAHARYAAEEALATAKRVEEKLDALLAGQK
jgi:hypothetical protein